MSTADRQTTLYRMLDERGRCIYIGITDNTRTRFQAHRRAAWWREVCDIEKVTYPTRAAAAAAEAAAIVAESPRYNVNHNGGRQQQVNQPAPRRDLMSLQEAADYLGVDPRTVRRRIAEGSLRAFRSGKRLIRIDVADLDAMLRPIPTAGTWK